MQQQQIDGENNPRSVIVHTLDPNTGNYGGILQGYALTKVISSFGHSVQLTMEPKRRFNRRLITLPIRMVLTKLIRRGPLDGALTVREERKLVELPVDFAKNNLPLKPFEELSASTVANSVHVFGSDQIWRPRYVDDIWHYFGSNLNLTTTTAISYAASFGIDSLEEYPTRTDRNRMADQLQKFAGVSIREETGLELLNNIGVRAAHHIDPTMLLTPDDYYAEFGSPVTNDRATAFCYILDIDDEKRDRIYSFCNQRGLQPTMFLDSIVRGKYFPRIVFPRRSVQDWVVGIASSDYVITDSFHGCVFAILFNRPFVAVVNQSRGATRFESLLNTFRLSHRCVTSFESLDKWSEKDRPINWPLVNEILREKREQAISYLRRYL